MLFLESDFTETIREKNHFIESRGGIKHYSLVGVFPPKDFREYLTVCRNFIAFVANDKKLISATTRPLQRNRVRFGDKKKFV